MTDGPKYELLPTGKYHISFSEVSSWAACSYRHHLQYVKKVGADLPGIHMDFGTAIHEACEHLLKTRTLDTKVFLAKLHELWSINSKVEGVKDYDAKKFKEFAKQGLAILPEVPPWLDTTFPNWEFIDAEHQLYEPIGNTTHAFKGFIDGVIKATGAKGKPVVWLLDWKSTSWGWKQEKKNDDVVRSQLVLYKNFWSIKTNVDPKDVRCGFVLLKRTAKAGERCELFPVSVGDVTTKRSLTVVNNMLSSVKRGIAIKNRDSCTWCEFKGTQHCT